MKNNPFIVAWVLLNMEPRQDTSKLKKRILKKNNKLVHYCVVNYLSFSIILFLIKNNLFGLKYDLHCILRVNEIYV